MSSAVVPYRSNFPQPRTVKPPFESVIKEAMEHFKCHAVYSEVVPKIREENGYWRDLKDLIKANKKKAEEIVPRLKEAVEKYNGFIKVLSEVETAKKLFQERMDDCYPKGGFPKTFTQEVVDNSYRLQRGNQIDSIGTEYNRVLVDHFPRMEEQNTKMKNLYKDIKGTIESLEENLEPPAELCVPPSSSHLFQTLVGPMRKNPLQPYLSIFILENKIESTPSNLQ